MQSRFLQIIEWLKTLFPNTEPTLVPIVGDASFRQYYRVNLDNKSYVVMDAPLDREKPDVFFRVTRLLRYFNLQTPECYAYDQESGFLLLDDFGDTQLYHAVHAEKNIKQYEQVLALIPKFWQIDKALFPNYEKTKFASELDVMKLWFWQWLGLDAETLHLLEAPYHQLQSLLVVNALEQPNVFVFRDFHSKNMMCLPNQTLGLIDFQDAVNGPITYDLVSVLKDCYLTLPKQFVDQGVSSCYHRAQAQGLLSQEITLDKFRYWFDLMGLQRHLKCLGIFTRQDIQNKRKNYLCYLPRVMHYIDEVLSRYKELTFFNGSWQRLVMPAYESKIKALKDKPVPVKFDTIGSVFENQ
ncbi:aminoglycoside phosphotransferase family protein [Cysteiniphilum sp. JM-1]|uniref:aminoglycoside phosphotransferase family protein n=1 Tax=Cysteiniphilum sp. JM-1 TaxID=2610891 RepID=UPI001245EE97|nr:phosphotransferase [Cysteiniphilum sp. JM-1]